MGRDWDPDVRKNTSHEDARNRAVWLKEQSAVKDGCHVWRVKHEKYVPSDYKEIIAATEKEAVDMYRLEMLYIAATIANPWGAKSEHELIGGNVEYINIAAGCCYVWRPSSGGDYERRGAEGEAATYPPEPISFDDPYIVMRKGRPAAFWGSKYSDSASFSWVNDRERAIRMRKETAARVAEKYNSFMRRDEIKIFEAVPF